LDPQERILTTEAGGSVYLKPRWSVEPVLWEELRDELPSAGPDTPLDAAEFVALDVETTGNSPFLVLEIGAERFSLAGSLSLFDTLVDCRAPINTYARRRHQISRHMLEGAPGFADARRAFLHFARGTALVEHSHDAFDTYLIGRGLRKPLEHPVLDTSTLARVVLGLPALLFPAAHPLRLRCDHQHDPVITGFGLRLEELRRFGDSDGSAGLLRLLEAPLDLESDQGVNASLQGVARLRVREDALRFCLRALGVAAEAIYQISSND